MRFGRQDPPALGSEPGAGFSSARVALALAVLAVAGVIAAAVWPVSGQTQSPPRLPDLAVAPLQHMLIELTADRKKRLRFTASIANLGQGPIVVGAARTRLTSPFRAWQQISRADGSTYRVNLPRVQMVFVGSKLHGHWHIRGAARYEIRRIEGGKPLRIRYKRGFCLFDSTSYRLSLPGAAKREKYPRDACGKQRELTLAMGVSVGWKDDYYWRIAGQEIDITSLPLGKYRLLVKVDPRNWFQETNELNNVTWVDLEIGEQLVKILGRSPRV